MRFGQDNPIETLGQYLGFILSYLLFTTLLFLIFVVLGKLPAGWGFLHFIAITLLTVLLGLGIRRLLE
jgi:hypothetical protein